MNEPRVGDALSDLASGEALAFRVDGVGYRWRHVFAHARRSGDWQILDTEVRQAQACLQLVTDGAPPLGHEVERSAAVAFRRARRLHAAEDVEAWLGARGLSVPQWRRYVRGEALRRRHASDLAAVVGRYPVDDETVNSALPVWGLCSGAFPRWAGELAMRAAAAHATSEHDAPEPDDLEALDDRFDRFAAEVVTPERLEALVAARYLDWLRIDCDVAVFAEEDVAGEALLCVRDDGWSLSEAALAGGGALRRRDLLVEETDAATRHHFVRARDGDLLGPLALAGGAALVHVLRKSTPSLHDDELRLRATREFVATAAAREVDERVEWLHPR